MLFVAGSFFGWRWLRGVFFCEKRSVDLGGFAVLAAFAFAGGSTLNSIAEAFAIAFFASWFLTCTALAMFYEFIWYWLVAFFFVWCYYFTLECHWVSFNNFLLSIMYFIFKFICVLTAFATAFRSTMITLRKAFTIKF